MKDSDELNPITQAINRIIAEAIMGETPASMEHEIEAIVQEWRGEPDIDHGDLVWRLSTLRNEMDRGIESCEKYLRIYAAFKPTASVLMLALQDGLTRAKDILTHLRARSLV